MVGRPWMLESTATTATIQWDGVADTAKTVHEGKAWIMLQWKEVKPKIIPGQDISRPLPVKQDGSIGQWHLITALNTRAYPEGGQRLRALT